MRFFGAVGYGETQETLPGSGVWEPVITEVPYTGDVLRDAVEQSPGDNVADDLSVNNSISIVADAKANNHFHKMKYIMWQGVRWKIESVEVRPPRLLLTLGGVYHGPTP
jgi:hypothetical protein